MNQNSILRQVHLDFHTFEKIPVVGNKFSKENFKSALKTAKLQSITVFAKCNRGFCYYPTDVGVMHPSLNFDLTAAMVDAAHEIGVRAPIYVNAGLSEKEAENHPEWWSYEKAPKSEGGTAEWCGFTLLCLSDGPYANHLYKLTEEICKRYKKVDGLFFDITLIGKTCYCEHCLNGMKELGLDYKNVEDAKNYFTQKRKLFMKKCTDVMRKYHPDATIFFNSGGAEMGRPEYHEFSTHFEMEDLPTSWGGYDKMPLRAKYFSRKGKPFLGMTGKFHLDWGEFGGYKTPDALKYEIASMALYGAGCSVGDHMHPTGEMDLQTYKNIGFAYDYLEKIEPYCYGGDATAKLGVYISFDFADTLGIANILCQSQIDFEIVADDNFKEFSTVIIPNGVVLSEDSLGKFKEFLSSGGKAIFFGNSLIKDGKFQVDVGAEYISSPEFDCDYLTLAKEVDNIPTSPLLSYYCGHTVKATDGEVIAFRRPPYFSRHKDVCAPERQIPFNHEAELLPAAIKKNNMLYCAHPIPTNYKKFGSVYHKNYFLLLLNKIGFEKVFDIKGLGAEGRATMIKQTDKNRYCLNMTYASPVRRGCAEIIEDIPDIYNIKITLNLPEKLTKAYLGITGEELTVTEEKGKQTVTLPKLNCHASVVLEYKA